MNASGLVGTLSVLDGLIAYDIKYADGSPAVADKVVARFKRPVGEHQDFEGVLGRVQKGRFELFHSVLPGDWIVEVISTDSGVPIMHEAQRIHVGDGPR
jgi:nitrogen fixation protein FixH